MKNRSLLDSFSNALNGVIFTLKKERNFKIHFVVAFLVLFLCVLLNLDSKEMILIFISITMVLVAELFNTSIEATVDLICKGEKYELARVAKDTAAGAVFLTAVSAVVVGYIIIIKKIVHSDVSNKTINLIRDTPIYITFICVILVVMLTVTIKSLNGEKNLLQGGMPSAHSSVAFSLATCILFFSDNVIAIILGFTLALLVAQSRVEGKIHSILQVILGSLLGVFLTILIFQLGTIQKLVGQFFEIR